MVGSCSNDYLFGYFASESGPQCFGWFRLFHNRDTVADAGDEAFVPAKAEEYGLDR